MLKNDTLKNGMSRVGLHGSAPPGMSHQSLAGEFFGDPSGPCIPPVPLHKTQFTYEFLGITKVVGQNDRQKAN